MCLKHTMYNGPLAYHWLPSSSRAGIEGPAPQIIYFNFHVISYRICQCNNSKIGYLRVTFTFRLTECTREKIPTYLRKRSGVVQHNLCWDFEAGWRSELKNHVFEFFLLIWTIQQKNPVPDLHGMCYDVPLAIAMLQSNSISTRLPLPRSRSPYPFPISPSRAGPEWELQWSQLNTLTLLEFMPLKFQDCFFFGKLRIISGLLQYWGRLVTLRNAGGKRRLIEGDLKQKIFVDAKHNSVQLYLLSFEGKHYFTNFAKGGALKSSFQFWQ